MSRYSVNGNCHRMLARLDAGPATAADLINAGTGQDAPSRKAESKSWRTFEAMKRDGLVHAGNSFYFLTQQGRDALTCLNCGQAAVFEDAPIPTVRVFERRAA